MLFSRVRPLLALGFLLSASLPAAAAPRFRFEPNLGQASASASYVFRAPGSHTLLSDQGLEIRLPGEAPLRVDVLPLEPDAAPALTARGQSAYPVHLIRAGEDGRPVVDAGRSVERLAYTGLGGGAEIELYEKDGELAFDVLLPPGAESTLTPLRIRGARRVERSADGGLLVHLASGVLPVSAPLTYQLTPAGRVEIASTATVDADGRVSFRIPERALDSPVVIDPVIHSASYFGGSAFDGAGFLPDGAGGFYLSGGTESTDLPASPRGFDASPNGALESYVAKISGDLRTIEYITYLGGSAADLAGVIGFDAELNPWILGATFSSNYPVTNDALDPTYNGGIDIILSKLSRDGNRMLYSTYLGTSGGDQATGFAFNASGDRLFLCGWTDSAGWRASEGAVQPAYRGGTYEGFVAVFDPVDNVVRSFTYLGGTGDERVDQSVDSGSGQISISVLPTCAAGPGDGVVFMSATTSQDLPTTAGESVFGGRAELYVAGLSGDLTELRFGRYLGGAGEEGGGVGKGFGDEVLLTGFTTSDDFPVTPDAMFREPLGGIDAFLVRLNAVDGSIVYATRFGGKGNETPPPPGPVTPLGHILLTGNTTSDDFPTTPDAFRRNRLENGQDAFLTLLDASGRDILFSTYLGGAGHEDGAGASWDEAANFYVSVSTNSNDIETTPGTFGPSFFGGSRDAALMVLRPRPGFPVRGVVNGASFVSDGLSPGLIFSIFGKELGPFTLRGAALDDQGRLAADSAGVRVLVNDVPAPIVFVRWDQIGAVAPYEIAGAANATVVVEYQGVRSDPVSVPVRESFPAIFVIDAARGQGAVLNQDSSVNSPSNPAAPGTVIQIFATGEGTLVTSPPNGSLSLDASNVTTLPVSVEIDGAPAQVIFAGTPPGQVAGFVQVNAIVPAGAAANAAASIRIRVGDRTSPEGVVIAVGP